MHQDVTARMRAEEERQKLHEELIEKERLATMGQTIAEVAHCMKNIFTAVNGGIYLLEQSLKLNRWDLTQRSYQTLRQSSTRLYLFLMNMLDFSKKRDGVREEVSVRSILDDVVRMLQASAESRNVAIVTRVEESAEILRLDSQGLFRTLLNLGLNSIDAMPKGGNLEFAAAIRKRTDLLPPLPGANPPEEVAATNGDSVGTLDVIDTGSGIPPEIISQIFEPFYSTKGSRGTGLGLSSARKFIHEQGGEIRVSSDPAKGTRFQLVFPL
jgi:signal transduction histidine kinase